MVFLLRRVRVMTLVSATIIISIYYLMTASENWSNSSIFPSFQIPKTAPRRHWFKVKEHYPVTSLIPLPKGGQISIPAVQAKPKSEDEAAKTERLKRQAAVKASFIHSWKGYKEHAWLRDEVVPVSGGYRDTFGGWAATLVDALDTLWIMGMKEEFEIAVDAIKEIDFTTTETDRINVFETTIRYLGGFLAAFDISGAKYPLLLSKAIEVGDMLMSCFDTPNRMPITRWDWQSYVDNNKQEAPRQMLVSELGSLSLEFTRLSQLSGDNKYYDAVQRIADVFEKSQNSTMLPGMWPVVVDAAAPSFDLYNEFHLGGMSDSLYEYLPKQFMMLGGLLAQPRKLYENFINVAKEHLFFRPLNPENADILISGEIKVAVDGRIGLNSNGQHLGCFVGGMVAIGSRIFNRPDELEVAKQLTDGCVWAYDSQVTGIAPELFSLIACKPDDCLWSDEKWHQGVNAANAITGDANQSLDEKILRTIQDGRLAPGFTNLNDRRYILRPEAIESVFIMYRITGDPEWQNKAWRMFERIEHVTKTQIASSAINDVTMGKPRQTDSMESFWLAETLKYFYLIFSEVDLVSLDDYVLNTEAHPLKRPGSAPSVTIPQGTFTGTIHTDNLPQSVEAFLGIPYALSTAGEGRFRPPVKVGPSTNTFTATQYGRICIDSIGSASDESEDCLSVNVFRPKVRDENKKLPVAVYIHGGAFNSGSGESRSLSRLVSWASEPILGVSFNYRVGVLGFLPSSLTAKEGLLNLGLRDQVMALQWVQDNIEKFGGDCEKVTIMGDSAGAHSIGHHLQNTCMPNLFHQVIMESGAATARTCRNADAEINEVQFKNFTDLTGASKIPSDQVMSYLRSLPVSTIKKAGAKIYEFYSPSIRWPFQPVIDGPGGLIPEAPLKLWESAKWNNVTILTGFCTDEGAPFVPQGMSTSEQFSNFFHTLLPGMSTSDLELVDELYPNPLTNPKSPYRQTNKGSGAQDKRVAAAYGQFAYIAPIRHTAHFAAAKDNAPPVYLYQFAATNSAILGTGHACVSPYVTYEPSLVSFSPSQRELAAAVNEYWTSFIATGDPNAVKGKSPNRAKWLGYVPGANGHGKNKMVFGRGNDERAGGHGVGITTQSVAETFAVDESNFWWAKTLTSET